MKIEKSLLKNLPDFQKEKTKNITTFVLTLVTLSLFGLFAISPTLSTIAQLKKQLEDSELVDQKLDQKITNLGLLQKQYTLIEKDIPSILSAIPQNPKTSILVGQLQSLAQNSAVEVTRIQVFQVEINPSSNSFSFVFSMDIEGSSANVTNFLISLKNFDRIITIDNISTNKQDIKEEVIRLQLRGKAYYEG